jgi:hypothetical protein
MQAVRKKHQVMIRINGRSFITQLFNQLKLKQ